MATYISLLNWTQKGIEEIKNSPQRLDKAKEMFRSAGVEMKAFYMTVGRYDMVTVVEARDEASLAKAMLAVGSGGHVRSETLRSFTEDEYRKIIGSLA